MSETKPIERILMAAGFIIIWMVWFAAAQAHATPIRPDIQKMLAEPPTQTQFVPARAGWHGPETPAPVQAASQVLLNDNATTRAARASFIAAAIPDPRAILAIGLCILLLRWLRQREGRQQLGPRLIPSHEALPEVKRAA